MVLNLFCFVFFLNSIFLTFAGSFVRVFFFDCKGAFFFGGTSNEG
jgi:hypothetical protein